MPGCRQLAELGDLAQMVAVVGENEHNQLGEADYAKFAVLLRIHYELQWSDDLRLSTRALVHEASEAGWHVWLLAQVISLTISCNCMGGSYALLPCRSKLFKGQLRHRA